MYLYMYMYMYMYIHAYIVCIKNIKTHQSHQIIRTYMELSIIRF